MGRALDAAVPISDEERKLVRKVDNRLLLILGQLYFVQCPDRDHVVSEESKIRRLIEC
jgi:hypothetical protein